MYCTDFEYDNKKLSDYDMIIGALNGSGGSEIVSSGADIVFFQSLFIRLPGAVHHDIPGYEKPLQMQGEVLSFAYGGFSHPKMAVPKEL